MAFDLRGHGNSAVPWSPQAYDSSALWGEDVANVIKATGIVEPLLVGWSYGGNVAMDFARHYADVPLAGYVLVSSAAAMFAAPGRWVDAAAMRVSPYVDRAIARRGASTDTDVIATIRAPLTLVFGGRYAIVAPPVQQRLIDLFPAARVVSFADAGHAPFLEDAARFNALLEAGLCKAAP